MSSRLARINLSEPRLEARQLTSERMPAENISGPIGSPSLTPCAEIMECLPSGEPSSKPEVDPLGPSPGLVKDRRVLAQIPPVDCVECSAEVQRGPVGVDHVPHRNGKEATIQPAQRCELAGPLHRRAGSRPRDYVAGGCVQRLEERRANALGCKEVVRSPR